jgi:hypothetical protein
MVRQTSKRGQQGGKSAAHPQALLHQRQRAEVRARCEEVMKTQNKLVLSIDE